MAGGDARGFRGAGGRVMPVTKNAHHAFVNHWRVPHRCESCGAPDARDAAHAAGCPADEPLARHELVARARAVETAWAAKAGRPDPHAAHAVLKAGA